MPALVFIHIPKAAGTSHRQYLAQVYGEKSLFWYGLDSESDTFDKEEVGKAPVVGGHRPLQFYPASFNALYTSIVRDPVARAVSHFNYLVALPSHKEEEQWIKEREAALAYWRTRGVDPSSMRKSIENCQELRNDISNLQCKYLSVHGATFAGVRKTLQQTNMIVGVFDQLQKFNGFFQTELGYPIENKRKANTAARSDYSTDILAEPELVELIRSLNLEDQRLYDFVRYECAGLYADADNLPAIRKQVPDAETRRRMQPPPEPVDWKKVHVFSKGVLVVVPGTRTMVVLIIKNDSKQPLVFSTTKGEGCAIGWQFQDKTGKPIAGAKGVARCEQVVPVGQSKQIVTSFQVEWDQFRGERPHTVEFSIVEKERWVRGECPLNSSWTVLHMEHPAN